MDRSGSFLYCVTAQCLTPVNSVQDAHIAAGTITLMVKADSEQDAKRKAIQIIAEEFEKDKELVGVFSKENMTLCIMDEDGHIVNYFWNFRLHRV